MRLLHILNESSSKGQLIHFSDQVEKELRDCLPLWVGKLEVTCNLERGVDVSIRVALEPSHCWPHGIWRNSSHIRLTVSPKIGTVDRGPPYKLHILSSKNLPRLNAKSGTADQILSHITRWVQHRDFQARIRDIEAFLRDP